MKLISWNVNGLRSVVNKGFFQFVKDQAPDILCLQETKLQHETIDISTIVPPGYSAYFSSAVKKGYSGVCMLFRKGLAPAAEKFSFGIGEKAFDEEGRILRAELPGFTLYNIYFPSGTTGDERQSFKYRFLDALYEFLEARNSTRTRGVVICGDFNICHKPIDIHHPRVAEKRKLSGFLPDERKWMDKFVELGFIDTYRLKKGDVTGQYSWWSFRAQSRQKNLGWRIDYFFTSQEISKRVKDADILTTVGGSDHCPILLELNDN